MPLSSYCKKCGQDVPVGDFCPYCNSKLAANTVRLAWCIDHAPVRDWMCWNAVMRLVLPVIGMAILVVVVLEALLGGLSGIGLMLPSLLVSLAGLVILLLSVLLLVFILQGDDVQDCVVDARGVHVTTYLTEPTKTKLLLRGKSPRLLDGQENPGAIPVAQKDIVWKDIARVQLWPEKTMMLFYAPAWWMRVALPCTPFTWVDSLDFIREKIGKKKNVILPPECRQGQESKPKSAKPQREKQLAMEDVYVPPMPIPPEEVPPEG